MDSATRASAFAMYFTTKENARGIGLSTASQLASRHQGQVLLNSTVGTGTAVRVLLPVDAATNGLPAS